LTTIRAAFQGEKGAFSEDAARRFFGAAVDPVACRDFDQMFAAVVGGQADAAVVPIENTLAGSIMKNYDLLLEHDVTIIGEVLLRVVHNLIGVPGAKLGDVRRVYSLPVALAQCERFLQSHPQIEAVAAYDTAGSVKMIMEAGRPDEAAIAGETAARAWGAEILVASVESNPQNFTRFVVVTRQDRDQDRNDARNDARPPPPGPFARGGERKTSVVFRIAHAPGGLYRALSAFAVEQVNLTKIESRPIPGKPWEYFFYLDFLGDPQDAPVARALDQLRAQAEEVRLLGCYPRGEMPQAPAVAAPA
jgi:prephenate dehydratase